MKKIIKTILSVEFLFAVFLLSGAFKEIFTWIPFDLTIVTLLITFVIALKRMYKKRTFNKKAIYVLVLFLCLIFMILLSLFYTDSNDYFIDKTLRFIFITSWAFFAPFLILNSKNSLSKFINSLAIIASVASVIVLYNYFNNTNINTSFVSISEGNYLGTARLIGTGAVSLLIICIYRENIKKTSRALMIVFSLFSIFALLLTGARMPVIALILAFISIILFSIWRDENKIYNKKEVKRIFIFMSIFIVSYYFLKDSQFTQTFFNRIKVLLNDDMGNSGSERFDRYETALNMIKENPFIGQGFGSFGLNYSGIDRREYAHNILLEVTSEIGLIGLAILVLIISIVFIRTVSNIRFGGYFNIWILSALIYLLTNAFVSGDLNDNRLLFTLLGIAAHTSLFVSKSPSDKNIKTKTEKDKVDEVLILEVHN